MNFQKNKKKQKKKTIKNYYWGNSIVAIIKHRKTGIKKKKFWDLYVYMYQPTNQPITNTEGESKKKSQRKKKKKKYVVSK